MLTEQFLQTETSSMSRGDHFFVWRQTRSVPFQHHGIDLGDGTVVHFTDGEDGVAGPEGNHDNFEVQRTSIDVVTRRGRDSLHIVSHANPLPPAEVIERALSQIGRRGYHLLFDNCEHFASWCVVNRDESRQVDVVAERFGSAGVKAMAVGAIQIVARHSTKRVLKGAAPLLLAADVAQWITEAGGHHVGLNDPHKRKRAGQAVGFTTAVGVGAIAGPAGIAVAGGVWVAGEMAAQVSRQSVDQWGRRHNRHEHS
jgi:hypothetical protein